MTDDSHPQLATLSQYEYGCMIASVGLASNKVAELIPQIILIENELAEWWGVGLEEQFDYSSHLPPAKHAKWNDHPIIFALVDAWSSMKRVKEMLDSAHLILCKSDDPDFVVE